MGREEEIRLMAYGIWEGEGCCHGRDVEHWLKAEAIWEERRRQGPVVASAEAEAERTPKRGGSRPAGKRHQGASTVAGGEMAGRKRFSLHGYVDSDKPSAVRPALERIIGDNGSISGTDEGFEIEAEMEGADARSLNRMLLSGLRRAEKRTRLRAEWTSGDATERFFDYVPKGSRRPKGK